MVTDQEEVQAAPSATPKESAPGSGDQRDALIIPAFFVCAAGLIIALIDPIYLAFRPHPLETLLLNGLGIAVVLLAVWRENRAMFVASSAAVFALVGVEAASQPAALTTPLNLIWPSRILIFTLVIVCWALFMGPPPWLRRAVLAFFVPTVLVLAAWLGPTLLSRYLNGPSALPAVNFAPFWLAADSQGTLYASSLHGGLIVVFDSGGSPQGTLRPARAPEPGGSGPGILPNGMEEEINRSGLAPLPTPTPLAGGEEEAENAAPLEFCGIAVDEQDHLFTLAALDPAPIKINEFDHNGSILAKYPLPDPAVPGAACLAVDAKHMYAAMAGGHVYIMDRQGALLREVDVPFQPAGIASNGAGKLYLSAPRTITVLDVDSGQFVTHSLDLQAPPAFAAVAVEPNGEVMLVDTASKSILRLDPSAQQIRGRLGGPGTTPGLFGQINGMAFDRQGRLYVADWQYRVVQRFDGDGQIDAVWWAVISEPNVVNMR